MTAPPIDSSSPPADQAVGAQFQEYAVTRIALALAAFALTSACGLRGDLDRPVPMWGNPALEGPNDPRVLKEQADKEAAEEARKEADRQREREERAARREQLQREAAERAAASPTPAPSPTTTPPPQ